MSTVLLDKVKNAIGEGILMPQDYGSAILASKNDPDVTNYLQGLIPKDNTVTRRDEAQAQREVVQEQDETPAPAGDTLDRREEAQEQRQRVKPKEEERVRPLTIEEIQASPFLTEQGIMPGDLLDGDNIVRKYSTADDAMLGGTIITQEDINSSPYLQENNVDAGSRMVGDTIIPSQLSDSWAQYRYGMAETLSPMGSVGAILERYFPFKAARDLTGGRPHYMAGQDWNTELQTPDEYWEVEGYMDMSPDQRRETANAKRERDIQQEFGQFFQPDPDSLARIGGQTTSAFVDPTLAFSMGATVPQMAIRGGLTFGSLDALNQEAIKGEVDPIQTAMATAAGATFVAGLGWVGKKVVSKAATKKANKLLDTAQAKLDSHVVTHGATDAPAKILEEAGFNPLGVEKAIQTTGRKLRLHGSGRTASEAIQQAVTKDSAVTRQYSKALDYYLGSIGTRLRLKDEGMFGRLRNTEYNMTVNTYGKTEQIEPFLRGLQGLPKGAYRDVTKHLYNGSFDLAKKTMGRFNPALAETFDTTVVPMLKDLSKQLKESGQSFDELDNYFPRIMKDYEGWRKSAGLDYQGYLDKQLLAAAKKKKRKLFPAEREKVIESAMRGYNYVGTGKPSYAKQRILTLKDRDLDFYAAPEEALSMYIRKAVNDIEVAKFFKGSVAKSDDGILDIDASVGKYVEDAAKTGNLKPEDQGEIVELLKARFVGGQQSAGQAMQTIKDLGYTGTIANPVSAVTQLADPATSALLYGFRNTIASMFGAKNMKLVDIGLEQVAIELTNGDPRGTARFLDKMMKLSGFKATDRLGKETLMNASLRKARQMAKSNKGVAKLREKYGKVYGDEFDGLVADLKAGDMTENIKFYAFNELADVQPIILSEMPEAYLNSPNGRILYMLKSFTLKQWDIVRREIMGEWNKGNKLTAVKKATVMAGYLTVANTSTGVIKDMMRGKEVKPEDLPDRSMWALLGVFGLNKYTSDKFFAKGDVKGGLVNMIVPATPIIDAAFKLGTELPKEDPALESTLNAIPLVGPLVYNWFGGGAEKYNERMDKERRDR